MDLIIQHIAQLVTQVGPARAKSRAGAINLLALLACIIGLLLPAGCSKKLDWKNPLDPANDLPPIAIWFGPSEGEVYSGHGAIGEVDAYDPNEGDTLKCCDFYWGTTNPPPFYARDTGHTIIPGSNAEKWFRIDGDLIDSTRYYWIAVVYDNHGVAWTSPLCSYTCHN